MQFAEKDKEEKTFQSVLFFIFYVELQLNLSPNLPLTASYICKAGLLLALPEANGPWIY